MLSLVLLLLVVPADLASSTMTSLKEEKAFEKESYEGRNILFGVREFAMACIANGFALSGYRPFVSTYLSFSDYLKPALRLSCLMNLPVLYIFTHDSISVGMDGPTHQPVEQLVGLRATPNLDVFRPADTNEVIGAYKAVYQQMKPACIILGRNKVPIMEGTFGSFGSRRCLHCSSRGKKAGCYFNRYGGRSFIRIRSSPAACRKRI